MKQEIATIVGGCFWCTEAIFRRLKGVSSVTSGYSGGTIPNPTYDQVCTGKTGHAEAIQITFDPAVISYDTILDVFFHLHNPTTLNQQGADAGTQYRSAIFYHSEEQEKIAEGHMKPGFVTEIVPYKNFYPADEHHQDYYSKNSYAPYCQMVIDPKIHKLMEEYSRLIK